MSIQAGTHKLGPDNAVLSVKTGRQGAAAKAGHDLVIDVTSWEATLDVGDDPGEISVALDADAGSLRVLQGTGGIQALSEDDKLDISKTIAEEVLPAGTIGFRSTSVDASDGGRRLRVRGDLDIAGTSHPIEFELSISPEREIAGGATLKQTEWGIKPYSALFGTLKVADEVRVEVEARLPAA